ncbi:MAG: GAF domain-containing protein [Chloroflexota bacterium]
MMYRAPKLDSSDKDRFYRELNELLLHLIEFEPDWLANLANAAGLLGHQLGQINWAGFYLFKGDDLVLGPFWGKPACTHIDIGEGVCGAAARERETVLVTDVNTFPGHIACDESSQAEIVVPIIVDGDLKAVLDIDAPVKGRFDLLDQRGLEQFAATLAKHVDWSKMR